MLRNFTGLNILLKVCNDSAISSNFLLGLNAKHIHFLELLQIFAASGPVLLKIPMPSLVCLDDQEDSDDPGTGMIKMKALICHIHLPATVLPHLPGLALLFHY